MKKPFLSQIPIWAPIALIAVAALVLPGRNRPTRGFSLRRPRRNARSRDKSQVYTLRGKRNKINYVGETNDPQRRAAEHKQDGKLGRLQVESRPMPRTAARRLEKRRLATYRHTHQGKNPPYNKTRDGGFHQND